MTEPLRISRRGVLAAAPAAALLSVSPGQRARAADEKPKRPKVAALLTEFRRNSHAEVILDRILEGYGWEGRHYRPRLDLVAMYVDQFPEGELSRERAARFENLEIYPSIAQVLTLGGDHLAVDGVIIIGEHGDYPVNEKGQWLYPRYEFFEQAVKVFQAEGRGVLVFNDKHLSWNWDWAKKMVDTAAAMKFPLAAGSSVPISWRIPAVELPLGAEVEEVMCVSNGDVDSYDFHALEMIQSIVERRRGGESGVRRVHALRGDDVWKVLEAGSWSAGGWDPELFEACLCRSHELMPAREGFNHVYPTPADLRRMVADPVLYRLEYVDGLKGSMLLLNGLVGDITLAARLKGYDELLSTQAYLGGTRDTQPFNFDSLVWYIERFLRSGKPDLPLERSLLATGLVAAGVESLWQKKPLDTPHLAIRYQPNPPSTFRNA